QAPHLTPLWISVICTRQAQTFINRALDALPPICLPAAFWTNTTQSFLQVVYQSNTSGSSKIPRAEEFQVSYFCRPAISIPWSPSPPFGLTLIKNLSLELLRSWSSNWLEDGNMSIDDVRRIRFHPWIKSIFNAVEPIKENPRPEIDQGAILKWCYEVEDSDSAVE
ncbi:hypothetical protein N7540_005903, partial [Penicillium herquei]